MAVMSKCPDCKGDGTMPDGSKCKGCDGYGVVIKDT
jgi:DnaJ-class molecular chaperone